jgi:hypothetical protein
MELFKDDPIAKSEVDEQPLAQIDRQAPLAQPVQQEQSASGMLKEKAMEMGADKASEFGMDKLSTIFKSATAPSAAQTIAANPTVPFEMFSPSIMAGSGTGAATATGGALSGLTGGAGAMGALGAAVPYIGMGLLAGKAFGLFSDGGYVGPLSSVKYKYGGGPVKEEVEMKYGM